jgi:hypothetical protein
VRDVCMKRVSVPLFPRRPGPGVVPILGHCFLDTLWCSLHTALICPSQKRRDPPVSSPCSSVGTGVPEEVFPSSPRLVETPRRVWSQHISMWIRMGGETGTTCSEQAGGLGQTSCRCDSPCMASSSP